MLAMAGVGGKLPSLRCLFVLCLLSLSAYVKQIVSRSVVALFCPTETGLWSGRAAVTHNSLSSVLASCYSCVVRAAHLPNVQSARAPAFRPWSVRIP